MPKCHVDEWTVPLVLKHLSRARQPPEIHAAEPSDRYNRTAGKSHPYYKRGSRHFWNPISGRLLVIFSGSCCEKSEKCRRNHRLSIADLFGMAESNTKSDEINVERVVEEEKKLKYLDFVHVAAIQAAMCLSILYEFAKKNSGPLKPGVQSVEGTVKAVIGPVYERLHGVPFELLKFVDHKVDEAVREIDRHVPSTLRSASTQAYTAAQKAPEMTRSVVGEVQRSGVLATASGMAKVAYARYEPVASDLYARYEPVAEQYAVAGWRSLNRLPLFPQVAQIIVPTAAYWAEKYNKTLACAASRGYEVAQYMPLVPTERIARVFGEEGDEKPAGKEEVVALPAE